MNLVHRLIERRAQSIESDSVDLSNPPDWMWETFAATPSRTGVRINEETALTMSAVWCAMRVLCDALAVLPLIVYRRLPRGGKERAIDHPVYRMLHERVNSYLTPFNWKELTAAHAVAWGNAYSEIEIDGAGRVVGLWPLNPKHTSVSRVNGNKLVTTNLPNGGQVTLPIDRVVHVPGLGFDGLMGRSVIQIARDSLGLTKAAEDFGAVYFANGAKAPVVLTHPGKLGKEGRQNLRESWNELHQGLDNAHRLGVLEEGVSVQQIGIPPDDSQFLQTRQFQVTEIARWFKVPPHLIYDLSRATFSNIEQQSIEFVTHSITPWCTRVEEALSLALLSEDERDEYFIEFKVDALLRGDSAARATFYAQMFNVGGLSINEIRAKENENPVEGGDTHFVPLNMVPLEDAVSPAAESIAANNPAQASVDLNDAEQRTRYEQRATKLRLRKRRVARRLFVDASRRVLSRELIAARRAVKASFERNTGDFKQWMDKFYASHGDTVSAAFLPALRAYADMMIDNVIDEYGSDVSISDVESFIDDYARAFGERWVAQSRAKLYAVIDTTNEEKLPDALTLALDDWERARPDLVADRETVRAGEAITMLAYAAVGVSILVWSASGDACPICQEMDGRKVEITAPFLEKGETLDPKSAESAPLTTKTLIRHPPLHDGCVCVVVPGT